MDYLNQTLHWFAELLWPARCVGCGTLGVDLCIGCLETCKPLSAQQCLVCRRPNNLGVPCLNCRHRTYLDRLIAATPMEGVVETAVYALKYRAMRQLAVPLGDWTATVIGLRPATRTMFGSGPLIVPVPLHPVRLRERDYNQAALLARRLARAAAMPLEESALVRVRHTGSQVRTRSRIERLDNMRGAFTVVRPEIVADRDIVLVDDVCTTGATLEDCARALKESGVASVSAIILARG